MKYSYFRNPFWAGLFLIGLGIFFVTVGQGWYVRRIIPVPVFGYIAFLGGAITLAFSSANLIHMNLRIQRTPDGMVASTPRNQQLTLLFGFCFQLQLHQKSRYVFINKRMFWFIRRSRAIPFRHIQQVNCQYKKAAGFDMFKVSLILKPDNQSILVGQFSGSAESSAAESEAQAFVQEIKQSLDLQDLSSDLHNECLPAYFFSLHTNDQG